MTPYRILSEYEVIERLWNRPQWLVEYVNSIHRDAEDHFTAESEIAIADSEFEIRHETFYQ